MRAIQGIIFDMDGVLIDSEPYYLLSLYQFLKRQNICHNITELYPTVGVTYPHSWQWIINKYQLDKDPHEFRTEFLSQRKEDFLPYADIVFPYVNSILKQCRAKGIKTAIASSSPMKVIEKVIETCHWDNQFDVILSGEMFKESKPHPEIYETAIKMLRLPITSLICIEDSLSGITAASKAGLYTIAKRDTRFPINYEKADVVIDSLFDIFEALLD